MCNAEDLLTIYWGFGDMEYTDPECGYDDHVFTLGARGEAIVKAPTNNSPDIKKVVWDQIVSAVKEQLPSILQAKGIRIYEVEEFLIQLSETLEPVIRQVLLETGVVLDTFAIEGFRMPENDPIYNELAGLHQPFFPPHPHEPVNIEITGYDKDKVISMGLGIGSAMSQLFKDMIDFELFGKTQDEE